MIKLIKDDLFYQELAMQKAPVRDLAIVKLMKLIGRTPDAVREDIPCNVGWFLVPHTIAIKAKKYDCKITESTKDDIPDKDKVYKIEVGETCFDENKYIQGMPFVRTELEKFLGITGNDEIIKELKKRYDLDFEHFDDSFFGEEEITDDDYFGCLILNRDEGKLHKMMNDMGMNWGKI